MVVHVTMQRLLRLATTLTAVGFALGGLGPAVGFGLAAFGVITSPLDYPPWRHAVMASVDATIVAVAVRRPAVLEAAAVSAAAVNRCQSRLSGDQPD
jgi:hypothetical protein